MSKLEKTLTEIRMRQIIRKGRRVANYVGGKTGNRTQRVNRNPSPIDDVDTLLEIIDKLVKKNEQQTSQRSNRV